MTYVANVAADTQKNDIGSLDVSLDSFTATNMSNDSVILTCHHLRADMDSRIAPSGYSIYGATGNISISQVDQASVRLMVYSLVPIYDTVTIVLPLEIDIPGGVNGDVLLTTNAPPNSLFK